MRVLAAALLVALLCLLQGCAKAEKTPKSVVSEAYSLLDKGQRSKAILLLESHLLSNPSDDEGKQLLASAYVGDAGLDVYTLHDAFDDVLFKDPFKDLLRKGPGDLPSAWKAAPVGQTIGDTFLWIDHYLAIIRETAKFLARLPDLAESKWPNVDRALELLDSVERRDLVHYRIMVRVVYLKSFVREKILKFRPVTTQEWLCTLETNDVRDSLRWMLGHLIKASEDLSIVRPSSASGLASLYGKMTAVDEALQAGIGVDEASGVRTGMHEAERELRKLLGCG